ncbi:hypothetical protein F4677DRAFT_89232 [Hypoxylon crocopeplum]|nr:hypothetical protein F4677DRAFT_89232 [Hypoxylon crocopeplum]
MSLDSVMTEKDAGEDHVSSKGASDGAPSKTEKKRKSRKSSRKHKNKAGHQEGQRSTSSMADPPESVSPSTAAAARAREAERLKQRRRLDDIVREHLDGSNCVWDLYTEEAPRNDWLMSGALVTHPSQLPTLGSPYNTAPVSGSPSPTSSSASSSESESDEGSDDEGSSDDDDSENGGDHNGGSEGRESEGGARNNEGDDAAFGGIGPDGEGHKDSAPVEGSVSQASKHASPAEASGRKANSSKPGIPNSSNPYRRAPKPVRIMGPSLPHYVSRVMPKILPTFAPATLDVSSQTDGPSKKVVEEVNDQQHTETPTPAPQP